ncbi:ATP synthase gamma chain [Clostridium polyendosporum]|uniref:ATP synthase gamma chain n=1 Tax=Clostridium polyendosporum TaxID=69208 RepID=A0A919S0M0_9CLOT|nr:ATP synthase F1 subunit gamma [Clostridium polyendosporum]GIM29679.1 ATP synthase gamma chain [Clostridium polyendosporum]
MAAGLIEIKRRIKSVTNTKKITKAMGLVATSKLRKTRIELDKNNNYYDSIKKVADELLKVIEDNDSIFFKGNKSDKKLYIVVSSDSGLCGGFNGNLALNLNEKVEGNKADTLVMIVGQKGIPYIRKYGFDTVAEYVQIPDIPTVKEAKVISEHAVKLYKDDEVGEVNIVYTHFYSPIKQVVTIDKLLPLDRTQNFGRADILIEPKGKEAVENILEVFFRGKIFNSMIHSKVSEQSSRMQAMDGATKNANDLLDSLNIRYNRIRQTAITQEISEIVGGAEAQK